MLRNLLYDLLGVAGIQSREIDGFYRLVQALVLKNSRVDELIDEQVHFHSIDVIC